MANVHFGIILQPLSSMLRLILAESCYLGMEMRVDWDCHLVTSKVKKRAHQGGAFEEVINDQQYYLADLLKVCLLFDRELLNFETRL